MSGIQRVGLQKLVSLFYCGPLSFSHGRLTQLAQRLFYSLPESRPRALCPQMRLQELPAVRAGLPVSHSESSCRHAGHLVGFEKVDLTSLQWLPHVLGKVQNWQILAHKTP